MQGDHSLAGAGPPADDRETLVGGADGLVLLSLNGGDDIAHGSASRPGERRHQSALPQNGEVGLDGGVQQVIFQPNDLVVTAAQHPTSDHMHGSGLGGAIEGLCRGRPPVDDERLVFLVSHPEPPDIAGLGKGQIKTAEHQALMFGVENSQPPHGLIGEGIPFEKGCARLLTQIVGAITLI